MMTSRQRGGIEFLALLLGLLAGDCKAQSAHPLVLKVDLCNEIGERYGQGKPAVKKRVERDLADVLVKHVHQTGSWYKFCWDLQTGHKSVMNPEGEIIVSLDTIKDAVRGNVMDWRLSIEVASGTGPARKTWQIPPIGEAPIRLLTGKLPNGVPTSKELPVRLCDWIDQNLLEPKRLDEFHNVVRCTLPVAEGVLTLKGLPPELTGRGVISLPSEAYDRFKYSLFRFRQRTDAGDKDVFAQGDGNTYEYCHVSCLRVRHITAFTAADGDRHKVYLESFYDDLDEIAVGTPLKRIPCQRGEQ